MEQTVSPLSVKDSERLEVQRSVVINFVSEGSLEQYRTAAGKLGTLRALLEAGVFEADQTYELQCMGIVLGDALVQQHGFEWVAVEDDFGRDPALRVERTSVLLFPLTMISKRVERGEIVDVFDLFNGTAEIALKRATDELGN
ncbi:DUF3806 domain-containing protein [Parasulfitobacter algicola]|uniref:DUF3806 domain-containing protein n=1 Tax=Parasulfitobacter algicola TaxID=2614809 RepID=A0ABX2IST1_9RHOB|nr:DUF3806 domain-containing protein [Sulfitobacter algicola]NSX55964.1 DUF3806 domain-containing protein [Sulfitobacter algicola]